MNEVENNNGGENNNGNNGNGDNGGTKQPPPIISPFDWRIWLLGIYLILSILVSLYYLAGLMLADTTESGKTLAECKNPTPTPPATPTPTSPKDGSNTETGGTNPGGTTNTSNSGNNDVKENKNGTTPTQTATPPKEQDKNQSNATRNTNTTTDDIGSTVPKIVKLEGVRFFPDYGCLTGDGYVFLIVMFAGMVGAGIKGIYSFFLHLGRRDFGFNWVWFYILLPFFGTTLSLVLYFVIRGGFYSGSVGKALVINVFSFAALGALAGLFSDQALAKLQMVAESLLTKTEPKTNQPTIAKIVVTPANINLTTPSPTQKLTVTATDSSDKPIASLPNGSLKWTSDNRSIATVDENGVITKVSNGTCNITVAAKSNSVVSNNCVVTCS